MDSVAFIDVRDVLRGIARRWLAIALFTAACAFASYWFVNNAKPVYTADAQVLIENQDSPFARVGQDRNQPAALTERDVTSQVEVVRSRDLALRIIQDLKLTEIAEFDPMKSGIGTIGRLMISFGFKADPATMTVEQRAIQHYYSQLTVFAVPLSSVITIEFESRDPELAARIANQIASYYVSFTKKTLNEPTGQARDWLATQIEDLREKVIKSETAVEKFRAKAGIYSGAQSKLSNEELSSLNSQMILASASRSEAKAKADAIRELLRTTGTVDTSAAVLTSPLIQRLREQQIQLIRSKAELSTIYLDNHPRIIAVDQEIRDLNKQLRTEAFKVVQRLEQEAKVAAAREASLRANLVKLKQETSALGVDDVRLRELEREAKANRSLLETFLVRFTDASSRQDVSTQPGLGRVISGAGVPSIPSFPKKGPTMLLATLGGFIIALGIAFVVEVMSSAALVSRASGTAHVQQNYEMPSQLANGAPTTRPSAPFGATDAPPPPSAVLHEAPPAAEFVQAAQAPINNAVLTTIPAMASTMLAIHASGQGLQDNDSVYRKAVEPVAISAADLLSTPSIRRLTIVNLSGSALDSITFTLTLGRMLALAGGKVAIADAGTKAPGFDVLDPSFAKQGLFDIVSGRVGLSDVIMKDAASQLQVMPSGDKSGLPADVLTCRQMSNAIQALEQVYQLVILHVGIADDHNVSLAASSGAVMVLADESRLREANDICDALRSGSVQKASVVCVTGQGVESAGGRFSNIAASF
jgi:uncharacterized protein involved in exopolysaccharide biosynthesis